MGDNTKIEWADATWQPVTGCAVVSPGCTNCYAMRLAGTRLKHTPSRAGLTQETKAGPVWNGIVRLNEEMLDQPLRWRRARRIFVCAHGDLFAEAVPDDWIDRVFAVMALAPQHTFLVLTKRANRMRQYLVAGDGRDAPSRQVAFLRKLHGIASSAVGNNQPINALERTILINGWPIYGEAGDWPLPNVWLGVSVEDQARADERIPDLLATPAAKRFISAEPLLGGIEILDWLRGPGFQGLDWTICGGESGPGARPMELRWVNDIVSQCQAAGVAVFVKQIGAKPVVGGQTYTYYAGGAVDIRPKDKHGGDWSEWPDGIRIREFPDAR